MGRIAPGDVLVAAAVAVVGQVEVAAPELLGVDMVGPRWVVSVAYLVSAAVLVLRRTRPGLTFSVVLAAMAVQSLAVGATEGNGVLLPGLVATYSLAAHAQRRHALVGLGLLVPAIALRELRNPGNDTADDVVSAIGWDLTLVAAWLLGAWLRTRRQLVAELEARAVEAEQAREERAAAAVTAERARIGRELHDVVGHSLAVVVVQAEAAEELMRSDPDRALGAVRAVQETGRSALAEMRRLLAAVSDATAAPSPGTAGLPELVQRLRDTGLTVDADVAALPDLTPDLDRAVYRIVQEALTNVLRHSGASRVMVRVTREPDAVDIEVRDDGSGGRPPPHDGRGLAGMRERVAVHGGRFAAGPAEGGGFVVRAELLVPGGTP